VTSYSVVVGYHRFLRPCCLRLQREVNEVRVTLQLTVGRLGVELLVVTRVQILVSE
jgi:hypothetical protein